LGRDLETNNFSQFFDALPQMTFLAKADGSIYKFNRRWYEYIGAVEGTEGWGWKEYPIHHPDDLERTVKRWQHSIDTGENYEIEYRLRRHDGVYRWHLGRAQAIRDEDGNVIEWFGTNTDIHDLKQAQDKAQQTEKILNFTLSAADIGYWTYDKFTGDTKISSGLMKTWGIDPLTFRNFLSECLNRIHPEDQEFVTKEINECLETGKAYSIEYRVILPNDEVRIIAAKGEAHRNDEGEIFQLAGITQEITKQKKYEIELQEATVRAENASRAKSEFLANMSHEIRTPLGAIMGFSKLAEQEDLSKEEHKSYLSIIQKSSHQVLRIIDDILDLAKVEAGKIVTEESKVSIVKLLIDFKSIFDFKAKEKGIRFHLEFEGSIPEVVIGDKVRIRQILNNIVGNAVKFTSQGQVTLTVYFEENPSRLFFKISDSGRGISEQQQERLFQPFMQADQSTTRRFGGTGLGLILTRRLCQHLGGDFKLIQSTYGKGSTFLASIQTQVSLRTRFIEPDTEVVLERGTVDEEIPIGSLENLSILLVEDAPENRLLYKILLSKHGAKVDMAVDGEEGLDKGKKNDYHVILMDIQMPKYDGHEVVKRLRDHGIETPIIALTAHAMKEEEQKALRSGFTAYLSKPVAEDILLSKILKCVHLDNARQMEFLI
tara:strand:+ start:7973 stop:9946 length:1974 start_codon:yes stop_codon:yes gene_type:complete